ncbi:thioredoxin domain-containing protein [Natronosporangium hydrolyticum]|uniref:Thioredoxin domain-containing protein n=1 Tax=Natronosporangium hydrolyticum TaxID=2811111 RepID=A0A895YAB2_9ACTN|nr:thioredoxin domain-containing protein [Natronosporangium hydrolyticum]QSB14714.1 thioredoxin domain-containing protein [Natronosporangium hydrolyticum]
MADKNRTRQPANRAGRPRNRAADRAAASLSRQRGVSTNTKLTVGLLAVLLVGLGALFFFVDRSDEGAVDGNLVAADSHRLASTEGDQVALVEFLDFECPACAQVFPAVEQLRTEYDGQITYVPRQFPLSSHPNAENAARAAEAAGVQGQFEQMYVLLFENQPQWRGAGGDQTETFVGYAEQLGLDVEQFRADLTSPEVTERIREDRTAGQEAGVTGTPTFFLNGERLDVPPTYDALKSAVDEALAE